MSHRSRFRFIARTLLVGGIALGLGTSASAQADDSLLFRRIASIPAFLNASIDAPSVAEIVAAARQGTLLVYTDALSGRIGFVDITDPAAPVADGAIVTDGEPTSVAVLGDYALAVVNTSKNFVKTSGVVLVIDVNTRGVVAEIPLDGQPDAIALSKDGRFAAIAIENERDEGLGNGQPPQAPGGFLAILDLIGAPAEWTVRNVDLAGVPTLFPEDPEPEFVAINDANVVVITLQENNHIALVDLETGLVTGHFPAGAVDLGKIDVANNNLIELTGVKPNVAREPDAIAWISDRAFATANEGDLFGGSRGFTIFGDDGSVLFDAGHEYEWLAVRVAQYPDQRSGSKGTEPEGLTYAEFEGASGPERLLFVAAERGSFVAVYRLPGECLGDVSGDGAVDGADLSIVLGAWGSSNPGSADLDGDGAVTAADVAVLLGQWGYCPVTPEFVQVLPSAARPEGLLAIPERNLFVTASELDDRAGKVRSTITIYQGGTESTYPSFTSVDRPDGSPMPWGALSGFIADAKDDGTVYAIHDNIYRRTRIFTIDVSTTPGVIQAELPLSDPSGLLLTALSELKAELPNTPSFNPASFTNADGTVNVDGEGIAIAQGGGFWIAHEGGGNLVDGVSNPASFPFLSPNMLIKAGTDGTITDVVLLPLDLTRNQLRFGFEGVASVEENGIEIVYVCFQREWPAAGDAPNLAKIGRYDTSTGAWSFASYPLDLPTSPNGGWVGVSEITALGDGEFVVIERDDQAGSDARVKRLYTYSLAGIGFSQLEGGPLPVVAKTLARDLVAQGDFDAGVILEKIESTAVLSNGRTLVITDNDGVGNTSGETRMLDLGILFPR